MEWLNRCGICEGAGDPQSRHDIRHRKRVESKPAKQMVGRVDKQIQFDMFSGFRCGGVRQEICNRWEVKEKGKYRMAQGGSCQYSGVLSAGLTGIGFGYAEVNGRWQARLAEVGVDDAGRGRMLIEYLGKKQRLEVVESNNVVGEFCWITQSLAEEGSSKEKK